MNDEIFLVSGVFGKNADGYNRFTENERHMVYADCGSPVRSQRDLAYKQGYVATLRIKMLKIDYQNQRYVEFKGKMYEVKESFDKDAETTELTCSDMRC